MIDVLCVRNVLLKDIVIATANAVAMTKVINRRFGILFPGFLSPRAVCGKVAFLQDPRDSSSIPERLSVGKKKAWWERRTKALANPIIELK